MDSNLPLVQVRKSRTRQRHDFEKTKRHTAVTHGNDSTKHGKIVEEVKDKAKQDLI